MARKSMRLGGGGRFAKLKGKLEREGKGSGSAGAIAASIGREKYGAKKMGRLAKRGRRRSKRS